jgi:hypothetical protein
MKSHTLRLFPVVSFRASNPPGPILLLRDFFVGFSIGTALFPLAKAPRSAVIFLGPSLAPMGYGRVTFGILAVSPEG